MSIGQDELSKVARQCDAEMGDAGRAGEQFPRWMARYKIDEHGLFYVAGQRALRAALRFDGQEHLMSSTTPVRVELSDQAREFHHLATATWIDGFAVGMRIGLSSLPLFVPDGGTRQP